MPKDDVVGRTTMKQDLGVCACETLGRVLGAVVAEAESDGFGTVIFGFEYGGPESLDLLFIPELAHSSTQSQKRSRGNEYLPTLPIKLPNPPLPFHKRIPLPLKLRLTPQIINMRDSQFAI